MMQYNINDLNMATSLDYIPCNCFIIYITYISYKIYQTYS